MIVLTGCTLAGIGNAALAIDQGRIVWVGDPARATTLGAPVIDLEDRLGPTLVAPAFVDAHAHILLTGRGLAGVRCDDVTSAAELLARVAQRRDEDPGGIITGQGWDDFDWPEGRPPTMAELDRAAGDTPVMLTRVEVHSALVNSAFVERVPGLRDAAGFQSDGFIRRDAFHLAGEGASKLYTASQRSAHAGLAMDEALSCGIGTIHEMSAPHLGPWEDLTLIRDEAERRGMRVPLYWGEPANDDLVAEALRFGVRGLAGDLNCDGALGSRTACLSHGYHDDEDATGFRYLDPEELAEHVIACTKAGLQAGFHCIGDVGVSSSVESMRRAADALSPELVRRARHRLEHVEMAGDADIATMAELGVIGSMQPMFDAWWGGPGGLYDDRLGTDRPALDRIGTMHRAGVPLAFGSDAPVTPFSGWKVIRAAVHHWREEERVDVAEAVYAMTAGAHFAAFEPEFAAGLGTLRVGAPADLAIWTANDLDGSWPALEMNAMLPTCAATLVAGHPAYDDRGIFEDQ